MYQNDVAVLKRVTRLAPLQFLAQPAFKDDRSQFLEFFPPLLGLPKKLINLSICFIHLSILCSPVAFRYFTQKRFANQVADGPALKSPRHLKLCKLIVTVSYINLSYRPYFYG